MKKFNTVLASALVVSSLLTFTLPVFADDQQNTASTNSQTQTTSQDPQIRAQNAKDRIQKQIANLQNAEQNQQYLAPIRQLQAQEKQIREQIKGLRSKVREQLKADRQAKNYTAMLAALNDMLPMQDDIAAARIAAQTAKTDWQQLKTDRQAKNEQAVVSDLQKIQGDVQTRINTYNKILGDLQKISQDLGQSPANQGSASPSTPAAETQPTN